MEVGTVVKEGVCASGTPAGALGLAAPLQAKPLAVARGGGFLRVYVRDMTEQVAGKAQYPYQVSSAPDAP